MLRTANDPGDCRGAAPARAPEGGSARSASGHAVGECTYAGALHDRPFRRRFAHRSAPAGNERRRQSVCPGRTWTTLAAPRRRAPGRRRRGSGAVAGVRRGWTGARRLPELSGRGPEVTGRGSTSAGSSPESRSPGSSQPAEASSPLRSPDVPARAPRAGAARWHTGSATSRTGTRLGADSSSSQLVACPGHRDARAASPCPWRWRSPRGRARAR